MSRSPAAVSLHVWRVPARAVPRALLRMAVDRRRLRALPGVRFAKMLGTGTGDGFGPGDADPTRYAALIAWDDPDGPAMFDGTAPGRAWRALAARRAASAEGASHREAEQSVRVDLSPVACRGRWSGVEPFGAPGGGRPPDGDGPVLALTRARLRPRRAVTFWRAVPPVAAELRAAPGLLARFGVGEAPVGWQGTISVWRNATDLVRFAYRQPGHRAVIERTATAGWYAEELFARFAVLGVHGDRAVLGRGEEEQRG